MAFLEALKIIWKENISFVLSKNIFSKVGKPSMDNNVIFNYIIQIWKIIINLSQSKKFFEVGTHWRATTQSCDVINWAWGNTSPISDNFDDFSSDTI